MRSAVFAGAGRPLRIEDRPVPRPGSDEVLVRVIRAGVCASDLTLVRREELIPDVSTLGHEFVGAVVAAGPDADESLVGERIVSMAFAGCGNCTWCAVGRPVRCARRRFLRNAFAQFASTTPSCSFVVPATVPDDVAALGEPAAVAHHAVGRAGPLDGALVAVVGAGPVGSLVAIAARRAGAAKVVLVARTGRRLRQAAAIGSELVRSGADTVERVTAALGGEPAVIFECAGGAGTFDLALRLAAADGMVVVVGTAPVEDSFRPSRALRKQLDVRFSLAYDAEDFAPALQMLAAEATACASLITRTVGLDDFPDRFHDLEAGADECKMLLDPWRAN